MLIFLVKIVIFKKYNQFIILIFLHATPFLA